jgi:hypothetical protein
VALVDYVRPEEALTTMLAHEVFEPKNTPPMFKYRYLPLYYVVIIYLFSHFSPLQNGRDNPDWSRWIM